MDTGEVLSRADPTSPVQAAEAPAGPMRPEAE